MTDLGVTVQNSTVSDHWDTLGGTYNMPKVLWGVRVKGKPAPPTREEVDAWHPPQVSLKKPRLTTYVLTFTSRAEAVRQYETFKRLEPANESGNEITLLRSNLDWEEIQLDA